MVHMANGAHVHMRFRPLKFRLCHAVRLLSGSEKVIQ
jgi:hypothetical protein